MQICAAECSEVERHLGRVGASHLTRAVVHSLAACRGASPLPGARSPPVACRCRGRIAAMPRGHARVSNSSSLADRMGATPSVATHHGESQRRTFSFFFFGTGRGQNFGAAVSRWDLLLPRRQM
ncbi:hypothetical protein NDU88_004552 [Pleurodeles waltl]|uniref:Uncharacterized protein n=1 Tax=Pleurodeles waltl TaxID=8319 RepID=A0AAV7UFT3_PLEWA|nr:hypothetical protein NDU88_004552 [Pleurodeles waltl]